MLSFGHTVIFHQVDLRSTIQLAQTLSELISRRNIPDILICNAAMINAKSITMLSPLDICNTMSVNMISHSQTMATLLPYMYRRNSGHIVTIASIASFVSGPENADYAASKFALRAWHEAMRMEIKRDGKNIDTSIVHPYVINTTLFQGIKSKLSL